MTKKRILVAIDTSPASLAACRLAAELAAETRAELQGLFIEDLDLLRTAGLPLTRETTLQTGETRPITPSTVEKQLRTQARRARKALERIARKARVRCSFRTTRGRVSTTLAEIAAESEWCLLGRCGWSLTGRHHVGSAVRALLSDGPRRLLILQQNRQRPGPIRLLISPETPIEELVDAARPLVGNDSPIEAWLSADGDDATRALEEEARPLLTPLGPPTFRRIGTKNGDRLARAVTDRGVVVFHTSHPFFQTSDDLTHLLGRIECPVLIVR